MKYLLILTVTVAVATAQYYEQQAGEHAEGFPAWHGAPVARRRRDVTVDRPLGGGRVFGTLGQDDRGLFGKGGYERNIFDDHRGKLDGSVHGTRVLGPTGDASLMGGSLRWQGAHAAAGLDVNKQIHGGTALDASAGGRWPLGRNGDVSAQGFYSRQPGLGHDYGGRFNYNYRF